MELADLTFC